jgi:hypothetical protein
MLLSRSAIASYQRSLKSWMGYVKDGDYASQFDVSAVEALSWLLSDLGHMEDFLRRYPVTQREKRRREIRYVVLLWLIEFAL